MIEFNQESCRDLSVALTREWLERMESAGFPRPLSVDSTLAGITRCLLWQRSLRSVDLSCSQNLRGTNVEDIEQPHSEPAMAA